MTINVLKNGRIVEYEIFSCNSRCPYFYYNYHDYDNIWCDRLKKRIFESDDCPSLVGDYKVREIPEECPLPKRIIKWTEE